VICIKCNINKPLDVDNFELRTDTGKFRGSCKECENKRKQQLYFNDVKKYAALNKKYIAINAEDYYRKKKKRKVKLGLVTGTGQTLIEKKVEDYLINRGFNFETEKYLNDCRSLTNNTLHFDFYLPDLKCCIEVDGSHHYKPIFGKEIFEKTKIHDQLKDQYCKKNKIDLIRVPYFKIESLNKIINI